MDPSSKSKPMLAAAEFDIKLLEDKDDTKPDLTFYMCKLMKDKAPKIICQENGVNENILHVAIRHDLKGVEDLIDMADVSAFRQKRTSKDQNNISQFDDRNTPLHDALDYKMFLSPGPIFLGQSASQQPIARTSAANVKDGMARRSSATIGTEIDPRQTIQIANQAQARANPGSGQARPAPIGMMCQTCHKAYKEGKAAQKRRKGIIRLLLKRDSAVLMEHNSAGLSPYLYLCATQKICKENADRAREASSGTSRLGPPTSMGLDTKARSKQRAFERPNPENSTENQEFLEHSDERLSSVAEQSMQSFNEQASDTKLQRDRLLEEIIRKDWREKRERLARRKELYDPEARHQRDKASGGDANAGTTVVEEAQTCTCRELTNDLTSGNRGHQNASAVKQPIKDNQISYTPGDLSSQNFGANEMAKELKELSFQFGTYENAYQCLFRDQCGQGPFPSEVGRQRRFYLEGNQRVSSSTIENFNFLIFEPMLASVVLSLEYTQEKLEAMPSETERVERWQTDEENLKKVFKWLKNDKKVEAIVKLIVKDNSNGYCSDETVEDCLRDLEVRYLDWNRLDLCAETLRVPNSPPTSRVPTSPPTRSVLQDSLIEISLYWTGLSAVLWSWSDTQGLRTLKRLQKVHLYIQRGGETPQKQNEKVHAFQECVSDWDGTIETEINLHDDNRQLKRDGKGNALNANVDTPIHTWLQTASKFADDLWTTFRSDVQAHKDHFHIKVALLDDGVDPTYEHIGLNLHHIGWPSLETTEAEGKGKGFYVSTNQHGSKMALLIKKVCPFVTICVAKLDVESVKDLRHRSFNLEQAAKAVEWAIDQQVDIIPMSWNARPAPGSGVITALETVISRAANQKILMFGAACDVKESSASDKWYPCDFDQVRSIGAIDMEYNVKKYVDTAKPVHYLFPGENIPAGPGDTETGNSGATALATGLAAAVLFCMKMGNEKLPDNRQLWMDKIMKGVFQGAAQKKVVHVNGVLQLDKGDPLRKLVTMFVAQRG